MSILIEKARRLKELSPVLGMAKSYAKNEGLKQVMEALHNKKDYILKQNAIDIEEAKKNGMKDSLIDRLSLNPDRIQGMIDALKEVIGFPDPIWSSDRTWTTEDDLTISRMNVPLGTIAIIYESRPNVTVDAFALALKSGNCILLRGSSTAVHSNMALVKVIKEGLAASEIDPDIIQYLDEGGREVVNELIKLNDYIDLVIPRGGADLIHNVVMNATVPTIETGTGNCHIFVDASAKLDQAVEVVDNAKTQRPGTCNTVETVLVHETIAEAFLPALAERFASRVTLRACPKSLELIEAEEATEADWATEYLDMILAVRIVDSVEEAIAHIEQYGTKHSEAILTENLENANLFQRRVDAAAVYVNASTRFTDGGVFGFGGEMGISTQKLHARGPIGVNQLVTSKYIVMGYGQKRP